MRRDGSKRSRLPKPRLHREAQLVPKTEKKKFLLWIVISFYDIGTDIRKLNQQSDLKYKNVNSELVAESCGGRHY